MAVHYEVSTTGFSNHLCAFISSNLEEALGDVEGLARHIIKPPEDELSAMMTQLKKLKLNDPNLHLDVEGVIHMRALTEEEYEKWQQAF